MEWKYRSDPKWLDARKEVLTATDFESLKSSLSRASKAALRGDVMLPAFVSVWMQKHGSTPDDEADLYSYGPAARGHILEPYAVRLFSAYTQEEFYHWDDVVVRSESIGFSPDAVLGLDCPEPGAFSAEDFNAEEILEVKCYGLENHGKALVTSPSAMKERFQIAWAMYCCPSIKKGTLLFYNPSAPIPMFYLEYNRDELEEEIGLAEKVDEIYRRTCSWCDSASWNALGRYIQANQKSELEIWAEAMQ